MKRRKERERLGGTCAEGATRDGGKGEGADVEVRENRREYCRGEVVVDRRRLRGRRAVSH